MERNRWVEADVENLMLILAQRLAAIVPAGFRVEAADGMLWYSAEEGRFPGQLGDYWVGRAGIHVRIASKRMAIPLRTT